MRESMSLVILHAENWLVSKPTYYAGIQMECLNEITRQLSLNVVTTFTSWRPLRCWWKEEKEKGRGSNDVR